MQELPGQADHAARAQRAHETADAVAAEAHRAAGAAKERIESAREILSSDDAELARLKGGLTLSLLARLGNASGSRH